MVILAEQHQPGSWKNLLESEAHTVACAWPDDCVVQWGSNGIVFSRKDGNHYKTAFFEAFPHNPATFIRGEGATIAEAEASAFRKFERYQACSSHEFEKRGYRNGAGFCKHCDLFESKAFEPWELCVSCGKPTFWHIDGDKVYCEEHVPQEYRDYLKQIFGGDDDAATDGKGSEGHQVLP